MKITRKQIKQIVKEEITKTLKEGLGEGTLEDSIAKWKPGQKLVVKDYTKWGEGYDLEALTDKWKPLLSDGEVELEQPRILVQVIAVAKTQAPYKSQEGGD